MTQHYKHAREHDTPSDSIGSDQSFTRTDLSLKKQLGSFRIGNRSFPEIKRPGCGFDHPPTSSAEVKERVDLYL
jgi:hypothetical protein